MKETLANRTAAKRHPAQVYHIQVLDRAFQLLDHLAENRDGLSLTELAERLELHKSTAHRLIMVLESNRVVERDLDSGKWSLGSRLTQLGMSALARRDLYSASMGVLRELVDETGETAHLGVIRDGEVVSLCHVESTQSVRSPISVGARRPVHCTSLGKAMLAFWRPPEVEAFLRGRIFKARTRKTITGSLRLKQDLRAIRARGYSLDDEEFEEGLRCIGAPVRDASGLVVAAISIAGPTFRVTETRIPAIGAAVSEAAYSISSQLGYSEFENLPESRQRQMWEGQA
ncbi:MAG TPA: IclR family transcriptional regulator [Bryobacteraceae bacterium]|nr:IclR family transcriptional regulator [Bryobacteraceae bacterium]